MPSPMQTPTRPDFNPSEVTLAAAETTPDDTFTVGNNSGTTGRSVRTGTEETIGDMGWPG